MATRLGKIIITFVIAGVALGGTSCTHTSVKVPSVVGKQEAVAKATLTSVGLGYRIVLQRHAPAHPPPGGTVIAQDPAGGKSRSQGSTVVLTVQAP